MIDRTTSAVDRESTLQQAAEWVVREEEDDFSAEDARSLRAWLDASPDNAAVYREMQGLWNEIPDVPGLGERWPIADNDRGDPHETGPARKWPRFLAGGLAAAAAAAALVFLVPLGREPAGQHLETGVGQISRVTLADGSIATLGPKTDLIVDFSDGERRLRLENGEAFFDVAKDRTRPFIVEADRTAVRAVGTSFNVKDGGELMLVAVLEGTVEVLDRNPMATGEPLGTLHRGDIAQVTQRGDKPRVQVSRTADIDRFGVLTAGWRDGWLSYENTTLAQIVGDLNRYYDPGVTLADPSVGALHVTASFRAEKIGQFLDSIPGVLPVLVEKRADGSYLLRPAQEPLGRR